MTATGPEGGFGLYLHWPFCQAKCPYCDFNSHVSAQIDEDHWTRAYLAELDRAARETGGRVLGSVFFGGGTPSLMPPRLVAAILERIAGHWTLADTVEVTLEANPTSSEAGRFRGFRDAGVNRLSLGVQALEDSDLRRLGRLHSAKEALAALGLARALFGRVSFDLIYARQDQTVAGWRRELETALAEAPDHLSLYQLTIEPGTAFGALAARGRLKGLPDEDRAADMWDVTQDICSAAGLHAYEVSNHARQGAESRHNLVYWRGGDYIGIGPGAHGRITLAGRRHATETHLMPATWLEAVDAGRGGESRREVLDPSETAVEYVMMASRLAEGFDTGRVAAMGLSLDRGALAELTAEGLIRPFAGRISVTERGRPVLNAVLRRLLAD